MDSEIKKISIDYGIKLGTVLFIITVFSYLYDVSFFYTGVKGVFFAISILSFGIISILKARKIQNQIISFKYVFTAYFFCIAIGCLISSIGDIFIFRFLDNDAGNLINEETMILYKEMREMMNIDAEKIQQELRRMIDYPVYSYLTIFNNYIYLLLMNSIIGLILAFILKKN